MAKAKRSNPNKDHPSFQAPRIRPRWVPAIVCALLALFLIVAMFDYSPRQYEGNLTGATTVVVNGALTTKSVTVTEENLVGPFGVYTTYYSFSVFGGAAWLIPVFLGWLSYLAWRATRRFAGARLMVMCLSVPTFAGIWEMQNTFLINKQWFPHGPGGIIGNLVYHDLLYSIFGVFGAGVLLVTIYVVSILFVFTRDLGAEFDKLALAIQEWKARRKLLKAEKEEQRRLLKEQKARQRLAASMAKPESKGDGVLPASAKPLSIKHAPKEERAPEPETAPEPKATPARRRNGDIPQPTMPPAPVQEAPASILPPEPPPPPSYEEHVPERAAFIPRAPAQETQEPTPAVIPLHIVKAEETAKARNPIPQSTDSNYEFPPLELLREQVPTAPENSEEEHQRNAENLLRILSEFGVSVTLGEIHVGPVITRYEVAPAPGVRVERIAGLDKNIALGMRAQSVRIQAPIPGKAAVGVEVPNLHPTPVGVREILESEIWSSAKAEIPIALGKDVSGKPLISDLTKMPHLLIAGATGSGKSVCINAIIASILYSKSPKDLRMILVDPKVVELKVFNTLPHMLIPVVTEPKKVPAALKWLLREMETRYQIFAKCNVRNIIGFNTRKKAAKEEQMQQDAEAQGSLEGLDIGDEIEIPERLPYIVAIIDELADLMMVAPAEIETSIARLAQLARAAGIHLIIATQRPSVNVITGVIKANLPSRIAFQVASQVDSRTIIDGKGADTLIGRGDMLFTPPGTSRLVRAQGAYIGDEEIAEVVEFLKRNGPPAYAQDVQAQIDEAAREDDEEEDSSGSVNDMDDETLYKKALGVLRASKRASTSMLQRRLKIGYNRAARIMEMMEERGIVGPERGSSPREILVDPDSL